MGQWYVRLHFLESHEPSQPVRFEGRVSGPFETRKSAEAFATAATAAGGVAEAKIYCKEEK